MNHVIPIHVQLDVKSFLNAFKSPIIPKWARIPRCKKCGRWMRKTRKWQEFDSNVCRAKLWRVR